MTAGAILRTARSRHGLSQRQLAIRARTSQAAISRIECGLVSPTVATLSELLRLMNEELVLESREVDWGHDRTLIAQTLMMTPAERIDHGAAVARFVERNRGRAA